MNHLSRYWALLLVLILPTISSCILVWATTDGFHHTLPPRDSRVVVWGGHLTATSTAVTWLQKRGLKVVERARLQQIFDEQKLRLTQTPDSEADVLRVGKLLGAQQVVFVETPSPNSVSLRGIDVETSEVAWSGRAYWPDEVIGTADEKLSRLTCQALATAWGYRPRGNRWILSDRMCLIEDTER